MSRTAAWLLVVALAATGCSGDDSTPAEQPTVAPTPLSDLATETLTVARDAFCSRVAPGAVEDALGSEPESAGEWANGERAKVAPGVKDVVHEFGCRWRGADGTTVSGWVFAPPVTSRQAGALRRAAARADDCRPVGDAPPYGSRSVAVRCADGSVSFHGLFGDAWLSCELSGTSADSETLGRAGRWCVTVAQAATA